MAEHRHKPCRLLWLSVNSSHSHASLALPLLERACASRKMNLHWRVIDCTPSATLSPIVAEIAAFQPHVLAATCYLFNRDVVLRVCRRVKALLPRTTVILGGPEFLGDNADFLRHEPCVDAVLRGEGEIVFPEVLERWQAGRDPTGLPGLCLRRPDGTVFASSETATPPPFSGIPRAVESPYFPFDKPFVQLESSRGCRQSCAFCTSAGTPVRKATVDRFAADVDAVVARGVREIRLLDRTFNASPKRAAALLDLFRETYPDIRFHLELHPAMLPPQVRERLAKAPVGQLHIEAGLQTGEASALHATGRGVDADSAWDGLAFLARCDNLALHVDLLAGLPRQSFASLLADTARLIEWGLAEIQLESVKVLPGTRLAKDSRVAHLVHAPDPPYEVLASAAMTVAEMDTAGKLSAVLDRFHNYSPTREPFRSTVIRRGPAFLIDFIAFLERTVDFQQPLSMANRIILLHDYADASDDTLLRHAAKYAWLASGLSPQHGLCQATLWKGQPPDPASFILLAGELPEKTGKCWLATIGEDRLLFVCGRQPAKKPPVAILKIHSYTAA